MTVTTHRTRSNVTTLKELRDNLGTKVNEAVFSGERPLISATERLLPRSSPTKI